MQFDVAIAGGGPAGAAASITLAQQGWRVLLAHDAPANGFRVGEGLAPSARSLLVELGVLDRVLADGHRPSYGTMSAWGSDTFHAHDFLFTLYGNGLLLDRARFDATLRQAARDAGVDVREHARLMIEPRQTPSDPQPLILKSDRTGVHVTSRMVIDAGGSTAPLSRRLGAMRRSVDKLLAIFACLGTDDESDQWSSILVEAVADGWWYSALLPSRRRLAVFLTDADLIDRSVVLDGAGWWAALMRTRHLRALVERHRYEAITAPRATIASSGCLDRAAGGDWLAVGDAAQSFDPLASKGIANALYTGIRGAQTAAASLRGDADALARYDRHLSDIFRVYLCHLRDAYQHEQRWADAPFWRRRHGYSVDSASGPPEAMSSVTKD